MVAPDNQRIAYLADLAGYVLGSALDAYKTQVSTSLNARALTSHTHGTGDIASGVLDPARLGLTAAGHMPYRNSAGALIAVASTPSAVANAIAIRGTDGTIQVGTPTIDAHAATKAYVDSKAGTGGTGSPATTDASALTSGLLAPARVGVSGPNRLPVTDGAGVFTAVRLSSTADVSTLAYRTASGAVATAAPTDVTHATPKSYVDGADAQLRTDMAAVADSLGSGIEARALKSDTYTKAQTDTQIGTKVGIVLIPAGGQIPEGTPAGTLVLERKA